MEEIIEMSKDKFMKILHKDDREKYMETMHLKAIQTHKTGDADLACAILKERDKTLMNGPFRIGEIKDGYGYLMCYSDITAEKDKTNCEIEGANDTLDISGARIRVYVQKVKLI